MITVSMKNALRQRPGSSGGTTERLSAGAPTRTYPAPRVRQDASVICSPYWTPEEFRTFRYLTSVVYTGAAADVAVDGRTRADAAVFLKRFTEKHGKEKCDMMMAELRRLDAAAWFGKRRPGQ